MTGIGRRGAVLSHPVLKSGDVAHLVERRFCTAEVRGSSPLVSTPDFSTGHSGGKGFESPSVHQATNPAFKSGVCCLVFCWKKSEPILRKIPTNETETIRTRQGKLFFWGFGFALPRLISRPQESCEEESRAVLALIFFARHT